MNLLHCLIFHWSRNQVTRREGNSKSHRATISSDKFKAVEWAFVDLPSPGARENPSPPSKLSVHAAGAANFISRPPSQLRRQPARRVITLQQARCQRRDDTSGAPANANTDW